MKTQKEKKPSGSLSSEEIKKLFRKDIFARHVGIELLDAKSGYAKAVMKISDNHLNGLGMVHGGAIFTLADLAFAAAVNSHGQAAVAINASISYLKEASRDVLYAEAKEVSTQNKLASYEINITDGSGYIVAVFQGLAYKKNLQLTDLYESI